MAERLRRLKKEKNGVQNHTGKRRWLIMLVSAVFLVGMCWMFFGYRLFNKIGWFGLTQATVAPNMADIDLKAVLCRGSECYWLNKDGVAYKKSEKLGGNLILLLNDQTPRALDVGRQLIKPETIAELMFFKERLAGDFGIGLYEGSVQDLNLNSFDFVTAEGWMLRFSISENAYKNFEVLKQTLAEVNKTAPSSALDYIDLRIPNKVYYKFR